jgi:cytochrome c oxidase assembly factor CtaG
VLVPLAAVAALYALGAWRLSRRARGTVAWPRPASATVGLVAVAAALVSPLDSLADRSFLAHMVQHMLLMMVAAPAMLLADPLPVVLWALPLPARARVARVLTRGSPVRRLWAAATGTALAWLAHAGTLWFWHVPAVYDAALANRLVHDVEHVSFFVAALLFWWPVVHPAPRVRRPTPYPARIVYLVLAAFQGAALGLLLALAPSVLYQTYAAAHPDVVAALDDQAAGGMVMWGVGGLIDMLAVLILLGRALTQGERSAPHTRHRARVG